MNCYVGLAKRIVKSFFPREIPVPQLEPLDARKIFYASSDEEVWKATLVWAEAKAQEREAAALKAVSETNTDESYDSDDSEVGVPIQPVLKSALFAGDDSDADSSGDEYASGSEDDEEEYNPPLAAMAGLMRRGTILEEKKDWNISDAAAAAAMWRDDAQAAAEESVAVAKAMEKLAANDLARAAKRAADWDAAWVAAVIIQAAARGRAVRAWNAFVSANKKPSKKPYDAHLALLLAAPVAPPRKPPAALKGKLGNLIFSIPSQPFATKKPSLFGDDDDDDESGCPYPDSDEDEGDGDYGTDDDDFGDFKAPASKPSKTGCPALGDGRRRLFLCN